MSRPQPALSALHTVARALTALVVVALVVTFVVAGASTSARHAEAQAGTQVIEVWGVSSGIVDAPKDWKFAQSTAAADIGSASAADPALDDSLWATQTLRWRDFPGSGVANHFRKDFDLASLGVEPYQVVGIRVRLQYDDTAVMYLNGTEVYRSIRGNLDPGYAAHPLGDDIPYSISVPWGGAENLYVNIPDPNLANYCELPDDRCSSSPYGSAQPPAISPDLLVAGTNTWGVTTWNNSNGGSGDSSLDHVFELIVDTNAVPPTTVFINEAMASNTSTYQVQLDDDIALETPDWIELHNAHPTAAADIGGWTIADSAVSWTIPAGTSIPADGYLLLAANDGDDPTTTPMQTNFKLGSTGDTLKLTTAGGVVADEHTWSDQFPDNSMGRPGDTGEFTYLAAATPGATNAVGPLTSSPPILRFFRDRWYNQGESVDISIDAFDPDGDPVRYSVSPLPSGLGLDPDTGMITGTANWIGELTTTVAVTDGDGDTDSQVVRWVSLSPRPGPTPLVLNEYNAVPSTGELNAGSVVGNGGDWFEFLVVEDDLDLRGWQIELRQRDATTDNVRLGTVITIADDPRFGRVPAGTIITIGEAGADDLGFDAISDWHIHLQISNAGEGTWFAAPPAGAIFNSTRRDQLVLVRDPSGALVTPISGETEAWDDANGGVSGGEVMNLCIDPTPGLVVDPVTAYRDNGVTATFGQSNVCVYPNPSNPAMLTTDHQDVSALRSSAQLGAHSGDVTCDVLVNVLDALVVARYSARLVTDTGPCLVAGPGGRAAIDAGDVNRDGRTNVLDALLIAQCSARISNQFCPAG